MIDVQELFRSVLQDVPNGEKFDTGVLRIETKIIAQYEGSDVTFTVNVKHPEEEMQPIKVERTVEGVRRSARFKAPMGCEDIEWEGETPCKDLTEVVQAVIQFAVRALTAFQVASLLEFDEPDEPEEPN